jgi:CDP-diacylglycerol--serine O-phosphatidyltransferase
MLKFYKDSANICTLIGLISGFISIILSSRGLPFFALSAMMFGVLCDVFDGWIARKSVNRLGGADRFGAELDSLADIIHSVTAPAIWIIFFFPENYFILFFALLMVIAGSTRLAYFSISSLPKEKGFVGLPVPYSPIILSFVVLFAIQSKGASAIAISAYMLAVSVLHISSSVIFAVF